LGARGTTAIAQILLGTGLAVGWLAFHVREPARAVRIRHL
jgi:hypothetical protein